jgi:outer membrane protein
MKYVFLFIFVSLTVLGYGQTTEKWTLQRCVEYALKNNISVKQADVQARLAALQVQQAKYYQIPTLSLGTGVGVQFGRSIDLTTNIYTNTQALYQNIQANSNVTLYNWNRLKNNVNAAQFSAEAALADVEKASNDAALNVATYYLQVLSANEQINISKVQIQQTQTQLDITKKQVVAGALPELNQIELEAQLANDSSNYIAAKTTFQQSVLQLKAVLNLDAATPFEVDTPDVIPLESFADLQPEVVYALALNNQPLQKGNAFRLKAAQKNMQVAKAALYPTLGFGISLGTNFYNSFNQIDGYTFNGYAPITGAEPIVKIGSANYYVQNPVFSVTQSKKNFGQLWQGWSNQITNNFGQGLGINLSIPVFNNGQSRIAYQQAKLNIKNTQLQNELTDFTLKNNIYTAYTNAVLAAEKFNAGKKSVMSAQKAYDFALKRYEIGMLGTIDLITNQNNLLKAKLQQVANEYDYIFKMKLLEFYKGMGLKL